MPPARVIGTWTRRNVQNSPPYHNHDYQRDGCVGGHRANPGTPIGHQPVRQPVLQDEKIGRTQAKNDDGVAIETVTHRPDSRYSSTVMVSISLMPRRSR